jgi:hypothetical protein
MIKLPIKTPNIFGFKRKNLNARETSSEDAEFAEKNPKPLRLSADFAVLKKRI